MLKTVCDSSYVDRCWWRLMLRGIACQPLRVPEQAPGLCTVGDGPQLLPSLCSVGASYDIQATAQRPRGPPALVFQGASSPRSRAQLSTRGLPKGAAVGALGGCWSWGRGVGVGLVACLPDSHTCEQLKETVSFLLPFRHNKNNPFLPADLEARLPRPRHPAPSGESCLDSWSAVQLTPRPRRA